MPTETPLRAITRPGELTKGELTNTLRATSWLLSDVMQPRIRDRLLLAKLSSLHADLVAEEEERKIIEREVR